MAIGRTPDGRCNSLRLNGYPQTARYRARRHDVLSLIFPILEPTPFSPPQLTGATFVMVPVTNGEYLHHHGITHLFVDRNSFDAHMKEAMLDWCRLVPQGKSGPTKQADCSIGGRLERTQQLPWMCTLWCHPLSKTDQIRSPVAARPLTVCRHVAWSLAYRSGSTTMQQVQTNGLAGEPLDT